MTTSVFVNHSDTPEGLDKIALHCTNTLNNIQLYLVLIYTINSLIQL